jgi:ubiquinone/menaquinone biosynthesis C-methylase UbiE
VADVSALPIEDESIHLVTAFMSLQDVDDMAKAIREAARVLVSAGRLCVAIVHPVGSAGKFESDAPDAAFTIRGSYFEQRRYADLVENATAFA